MKESDEQCECGEEGKPDHPCPYAEDIYNECDLPYEERTMCNCCDKCSQECCNDI